MPAFSLPFHLDVDLKCMDHFKCDFSSAIQLGTWKIIIVSSDNKIFKNADRLVGANLH